MINPAFIKAPRPQDDKITYENGDTKDIITTVLFGDSRCGYYTKAFSKAFVTPSGDQGKQLLETCKAIWQFVKENIPYKLDPGGHQFIKSPGRLWQEKAGDCKSFSVFCASILKNLGIEYGYRFASYSKDDPTPTHVYIYVPVGAGLAPAHEIIIDAVWNGPFNTQKQYEHKQDHLMAKIAYLGTTDTASNGHFIGKVHPSRPNPHRGMLVINKHYDEITDGELALMIARQKIEIDQDNARRLGSTFKDDGYQKMLDMVNHAIDNVNNPDVIEGMGDYFIGSANGEIGKIKVGKFLKKVGKGIKNVTKAVTKVATLPMRLLGKAAVEIWLPKAAPAFLYLFTADAIVSKLPDKMKRKREKAVKLKNFICKSLAMKEPHFMGIIRNNLTKRFKQSPEAFLADQLKKAGISGISGKDKIIKKKVVNKKKELKKAAATQAAYHAPAQLTTMPAAMQPMALNITSPEEREALFEQERQQAGVPSTFSKVSTGIQKVGEKVGGLWGGIIQAVGWILSKFGGKKNGVEFTGDDVPDIVADAANAFNFKDLTGDYSNLTGDQKAQAKELATRFIDEGEDYNSALKKFSSIEHLNEQQARELAAEVDEGFEPIDEDEANETASAIRKAANLNPEQNGGGSTGFCKC